MRLVTRDIACSTLFVLSILTLSPSAFAADASPYSLPWQLRPVTAGTAIRSDTSFAGYENPKGQGGFTVVTELLASFRIPSTGPTPGTGLAPIVKLTAVNDSPPKMPTGASATGGFALVNPLLGASYAVAFDRSFRVNGFLGLTLPIGMGGGSTPNAGELDARNAGLPARAAMDNALFAVNDIAIIPGLDVAYVAHGFTFQAEATFFQLQRVRGSAKQLEASKTNFTSGIHAGYFIASIISIGVDLRYQRWLNPPFAVETKKPGTSLDLVSLGVGPRLHFKLAPGLAVHPGIAYTRGFDHPMTSPGNYNVVQLDVPFVF